MDYEKKYNEALERARNFYNGMRWRRAKDELEKIFPELRGSEDERIRKWLADYFGSIKETVWIHRNTITCEQILTWLEKQKEQKQEWSEEDKKLIDDVINSLCCYQNTLSDYQKEIVGEEIRKLKSLRSVKREWSEEDERIINALILELKTNPSVATTNGYKRADYIDWLNNLRPSWKPSEMHLSALLAVFNDPDNIGSQTCQLALTDLYEQLKKL